MTTFQRRVGIVIARRKPIWVEAPQAMSFTPLAPWGR